MVVEAGADSGAGSQAEEPREKSNADDARPEVNAEEGGEKASSVHQAEDTRADDADVAAAGGSSTCQADQSAAAPAPRYKAEGGLGLADDMPTPSTQPRALGPGDTLEAPANPSSSAAASASSSKGQGKGKGAAQESAKGKGKGDAAEEVASLEVPEARHKYKSGGLRTTVNTPETLVTEADPEEVVEPEQYMYYAQQYAALAQQYAAYAQYCAQFAPQAAAASEGPPARQPAQGSGPAEGQGSTVASQSQQSQAQQKNTPIMITPYRHNWLISGNHRGNQEGNWYDGLKGELAKTLTTVGSTVGSYIGGCRACAPVPGSESDDQCKQM
eukprot:TRINITY_DN17602_c0_g1_i1.p1 TRINITY_DN17602_c0_g1~~TRINITY_DN17602_c0_g1_i1.p1  ORF type:complete len:329 (-),score=79.29 TRINITY_DN17602_c0_g1_i1:96-1082(-)